MDFIQKADQPGLYIMDEPEAALSPQRQITKMFLDNRENIQELSRMLF